MKIEELSNLGMSDGIIDLYIKNKKITVDKGLFKMSNDLVIRLFLDTLKNGTNNCILMQSFSDDEFTNTYIQLLSKLYSGNIEEAKIYLNIINRHYPDNDYKDIIALYNFILNDIETKDLRIIYDDNMYIGYKVNLVKKYLRFKQYAIVSDLLAGILKTDDNIYLQILRNVCLQLPSKTNYIVNDSKIKDEATIKGIARMERQMLIDLEQGESLILSPNFNNLVRFEVGEEVYAIIVSLINWIDYFRINYRKLSNRDSRAVYGDFDSVVSALLISQDFYRLRDVINDALASNEIFSIKVQIYKILIDWLMYYNKRNKEFIDRERLTSLNKKNEKMLMERYPVSSISVDTIDDEIFDMQVDLSKNYYQVYQNYYDAKKYKDARRALRQFKVNMVSLDVNMNLDYLFKELDVLIANDNDSLENKNKVDTLLKEAEERELNDIDSAITLYLESLKYQSIKNPRTMSKVGALYARKNDYERALLYYKEADKSFVCPNDYITMMELLIKCKNYREVATYARKYDSYYPEENAYVYYLLSIAYANQELYDFADDALNTADAINVACYNVPIPYTHEHEILSDLKKKKSVNLYTIDDFVNYDLNDQEKALLGHIDDLKKQDEDSYISNLKVEGLNKATIEEKITYLLMLIKIFNYKEDDEQVNDLIELVEDILSIENVPYNVKEEASKKLSIYKID